MKYFAQYIDGVLVSISTGAGEVEISEEEYNRLLHEINDVIFYSEQVYLHEMEVSSVPEEYRERVSANVAERIEGERLALLEEVSLEEIAQELIAVMSE